MNSRIILTVGPDGRVPDHVLPDAVVGGDAGLPCEVVEDPAQVQISGDRLALVQISTPAGLARVGEIAAACRGKAALLAFDGTALARVLGREALQAAASSVALAAMAVGVPALGLAGDEAADPDFAAFADLATASRELGFAGAVTRIPDAVDVLAHVFSDDPKKRAELARVVADYRRLALLGQISIPVTGTPERLGLVARVKTHLALKPPLS